MDNQCVNVEENEEIMDADLILTKKYKSMKHLLNLTGLCFRRANKCTNWKCVLLRLLVALTLIGLVAYQLATYLWFLFNLQEYNSRVSRTIVMTLWMLKAFCSMLFLLYWEFRNYNHRLLTQTLCLTQKDPSSLSKSDRLTQCLLIGFVVTTACTSIVCTTCILLNKLGYTSVEFLVFDVLMVAYGPGVGAVFVLLINFHAFTAFNIILVFFIVTTLSIRLRVAEFVRKLKQLGKQPNENTLNQLLALYDEYRLAIRIIRETNHIFEVYTFLSIGTNIPLMIFTMLTLQMNVSHSFMDILYSIPELVFVFVEVFALTFSPAAIQQELTQIEPLIYENRRLWFPYSQQMYEIAHLYIQMSKQSNLGVTVWGFVAINKTMILTTASLTITYFTLILQLGYGSESSKSVNSTLCT